MDGILHGPNLITPIPTISIGIRLFEKLKSKQNDVLYIDVSNEKKTTYGEFLDLSCRLAKSFQNLGYKEDDVVAISCENNSLYNVPVVASLFLGMISSFINQTYTKNEFLHILDIYQPKIIFISSKLLPLFIELKEKYQDLKIIILDDQEVSEISGYDNLKTFIQKNCDSDFNVETFKPIEVVNTFEKVAFIASSSGTTGMPKGVMLTHDNIAMRANQLDDPRYSLAKPETIILIVPNFHVYGITLNICGILKGDKIIVMKRFDEETFLKSIEKYSITNLPIVPTIASILIKSNHLKKYNLSTVEEILCGSSCLSKEVEEKLLKNFPNIKCFRQAYGLTEATIMVTIMPTGERKLGSSGKVVPGTSLCFCDDLGNRLGPNQPGEIYARGKLVSKGYYRNLEATKSTFINEWLRTGDFGYYDEEGYVFIIDRIKDIIKYKGFQVPPIEIEGILISHPDVKAACVVGKPDELAGELPTAFVVKKENSRVTEEELIQFVADRISKTKHLYGGVYFLNDLPKTPSGKVKRRDLRDLLIKLIKN